MIGLKERSSQKTEDGAGSATGGDICRFWNARQARRQVRTNCFEAKYTNNAHIPPLFQDKPDCKNGLLAHIKRRSTGVSLEPY